MPENPANALRARHVSEGLGIDTQTGCAGWLGERLNVIWAIDVLRPPAPPENPDLTLG